MTSSGPGPSLSRFVTSLAQRRLASPGLPRLLRKGLLGYVRIDGERSVSDHLPHAALSGASAATNIETAADAPEKAFKRPEAPAGDGGGRRAKRGEVFPGFGSGREDREVGRAVAAAPSPRFAAARTARSVSPESAH